jgi:hypothetical protein
MLGMASSLKVDYSCIFTPAGKAMFQILELLPMMGCAAILPLKGSRNNEDSNLCASILAAASAAALAPS